jgi:hypothetical protein
VVLSGAGLRAATGERRRGERLRALAHAAELIRLALRNEIRAARTSRQTAMLIAAKTAARTSSVWDMVLPKRTPPAGVRASLELQAGSTTAQSTILRDSSTTGASGKGAAQKRRPSESPSCGWTMPSSPIPATRTAT